MPRTISYEIVNQQMDVIRSDHMFVKHYKVSKTKTFVSKPVYAANQALA